MPTGVEIANAYVALQIKMPGAARDIAVELGKAAPATESAGRNIGSSILSGVGSVLKAGAIGVGTVAGAALGTALFKGFQRLDAIDTARAKLTGLGNDANTVKDVMANALSAVKGTAFGLGDASTVAAQLVAAQIKPGQQLEGVLKSVANSAAAAGTGIGEMGSIYAKVASLGKAQNDVLQQVADRGIPIYQELSKKFGVTTDEIFKMASAGKIGFADFQEAMTSAAGTVASEMGNTVKGSWANFIASLGRIGAGLMSGLFPKVTPAIQAMTKALGPLEDIAARAGEALGKWLGPWIDDMTAWVAAIDFTKVEAGVIGIYNLVAKGDFTSQFREAFNLEEDSVTVTRILRIRDAVTGLFDLFVKGDYSSALRNAFNMEEDSNFVSFVLGARNAVQGLYDILVKGQFSSTLRDAFNVEEDSGFVTFLLGIREGIGSLFSSLTSGDFSGAASSIGNSLTTLGPAFAEFGAQMPKIGQATADLAAGGLTIVTQVLSFLADNVDTIVQFMPLIVAGFIAWRFASAAVANATLALRAGELAATPVYFANNVMRNNSVRIERELALAKAASTGATNVSAAATTRSTFATLAASTASRVAAAGQWLLNAALSANPIGIIILAITALVGALVWFFTQTELGQQIWSNVMGAIGTAATWLWETVLQPVFTAIGAVVTWVWENVFSPIGTLIVNYFRFWGAVAVWLWENVLGPVFGKIGEIFTWIYQNVILPYVNNIVASIQTWAAIFTWLYQNVVQPVFAGIMSVLSSGYVWLRDNVFSPLGFAIDAIAKAFGITADSVGKAWEGIKQAAAAPINFVLDTIWNKGLRSFWNDLVRELKLDDMALPMAPLVKFASGGVMPGYTPGRDVHQFWSPTAGGLALSGGEAIMRPEFTRLVGGAAGVDALNAAARSGQLPVGDGPGTFAGDVWDTITRAASMAWEFLTNPGQAIQKHVIDGIIGPMMSGQNLFGRTVGGLAGNTLKAMAGLFPSASSVSGGAGMGWEAMWKIVQAGVPGAVLTSAARPGAVTANGGQSYHALGRAIDLIPASMATFDAVAKLFPNASELIYSPAGKKQLLNGQPFDGWSDAVRAQHYNHVHLAMANGGVVPKLYDDGGWLPHGGIAMNLSGRPEPVFTDEQWGTLRKGGGGAAVIVQGDVITQDVPELFRVAEKAKRRSAARTATAREVT
ncbi:tape measure domain-containing protein [Microbacterium sp. 1154]|uniref:tape measure protein n=1 Tax=Microbacterium sp. 1154 TaxID=2817733 RepID=UPI002854A2B1|nr:tape measure protein [Microbacterium sp. 1154]MDR6691340.1 tape measure domain-containing protein [Microbacterium sp. 1154]